MTITFVTGANRGIGYEAVRRFVALGHDVLLGARDPERGAKAAAELGARFVAIDVRDQASVDAAAADVAAHEGRIDVLVNNAGIPGPRVSDILEVTAAEAERVMQTNYLGTLRTTRAFLPLLDKSDAPRIVNVSSSMGSFTRSVDPATLEHATPLPFYQPSKAAINMLTLKYAEALPRFRVNIADPARQPPRSTTTSAPRPSPRAPTSSSNSPPSPRTDPPAATSAATEPSRGDRRRPCGDHRADPQPRPRGRRGKPERLQRPAPRRRRGHQRPAGHRSRDR
ncbi:SDR family NAD(P)-dependent oxidoreductase [Amycolatopsis jiangsuensis]|uniref:NAD(P)-dependent dehydrogenase (Short-subunit alcohol dehydrogenase family) n=1 Tax=Amycolatopsis jiangsuensis TaxID=1181879 RepID=A0A840IUI0_9PSEU|nr:SDR family NAD(P)-dependent oxidoreductase [Amycolatopsis jiangsuensis]MBB4686341.1 NAD(P)-dependent dehydrogenase (short-subunit alcohol dehydrogenase family) [Amycolatopsis jiangsuensis]